MPLRPLLTLPLVLDFAYLVVPIDDVPWAELGPHLPHILKFIKQGIASGGVLVHCLVGMSRSASAVIAYLMKANKLSFEEGLAFVKQCRPIAQPNQVRPILCFFFYTPSDLTFRDLKVS